MGREARVTEAGEHRFFAGWRSDPFFFDAPGAVNNFQFEGNDFFADKDVCSIVLELPNSLLGPKEVGLWARTLIPAKGAPGSWVQVDRGARPSQTPFLSGDQNEAYRAAEPADDARFVALFAHALEHTGGYAPEEAKRVAGTLLPDLLRYDPTRAASFPGNGRALTDDVSDYFLAILTNGKVTGTRSGRTAISFPTFPTWARPIARADERRLARRPRTGACWRTRWRETFSRIARRETRVFRRPLGGRRPERRHCNRRFRLRQLASEISFCSPGRLCVASTKRNRAVCLRVHLVRAALPQRSQSIPLSSAAVDIPIELTHRPIELTHRNLPKLRLLPLYNESFECILQETLGRLEPGSTPSMSDSASRWRRSRPPRGQWLEQNVAAMDVILTATSWLSSTRWPPVTGARF